MKRVLLSLAMSIATFSLFAQIVIYDGETISPNWWPLAGSPPNGSLNEYDNAQNPIVSLLLNEVANPDKSGLNTSDNVVRFIRSKDGQDWCGAGIGGLIIDLNTYRKFSIMVKKPIAGKVALKLEGGGDAEQVSADYTTPGQWQKLEFTFNKIVNNPRALLIFPHQEYTDCSPMTNSMLVYWDNITMYDASNNPTVIYNGEDVKADYFSLLGRDPNRSLYDLVNNGFPNIVKDNYNGSDHMIRSLRSKDGLNWSGAAISGLSIDVRQYHRLSAMIKKSVAGRVVMKLEGAGDQEVTADYTTPNQWQTLVFDFDPKRFSGNPGTLLIFTHFENTDLTPLSENMNVYIDNILLDPVINWSGNGNWSDSQNWSPNSNPEVVVNNGILTVNNNLNTGSITLKPGAGLSLNAGNTLNVSGNFTIESDMTGTGTFLDNGTVKVTGTTNVQQYLTGSGDAIPNSRFWYMSSPVTGANSGVFFASGANRLWDYSELSHGYSEIVDDATELITGKGYVARLGANATVTFSGSLNTGEKTISLSRQEDGNAKRGFNLIGNPYPSFLDWKTVTKIHVLPTIWYRTYSIGNTMLFDTYNASSNVGTNNSGKGEVTQYIPPMQAFWAKVDADGNAGSVTTNNSLRSHQSENFLRNAETTKQQVLRLQVSNGSNRDEAIVVFNTNASDGYDQFDSPKMSNNIDSIPEIYTMAGIAQVAINGLSSLTAADQLTLGFKAGKTDSYAIKATEMSNFDSDMKVMLVDNLLNATQDLTDGATYNFNSDPTNTTDRFKVVLSRLSSITTGIEQLSNPLVFVYKNENGQISVKIKSKISQEGIVTFSTVLGQKILSARILGETTVIDANLTSGIYMVSVNIEGKPITKKIMINRK